MEGYPGQIHSVVPTPTGVQTTVSKVIYTTSGLVCNTTQSQAPSVCLPDPKSGGLGSGFPKPEQFRSGSLCVPPDISHSQGGLKLRQYNCVVILIAPGWPEMPWFLDLVQLSLEISLKLPVFLIQTVRSFTTIHNTKTSRLGI